MTRKFVDVCSLVILIAVAMLPGPAHATTWSPYVYQTENGNFYRIHEGHNFIPLGLRTDRQARRVARKLN